VEARLEVTPGISSDTIDTNDQRTRQIQRTTNSGDSILISLFGDNTDGVKRFQIPKNIRFFLQVLPLLDPIRPFFGTRTALEKSEIHPAKHPD
jgi:hypothetical protein